MTKSANATVPQPVPGPLDLVHGLSRAAGGAESCIDSIVKLMEIVAYAESDKNVDL
jgi:hypothetical protein